MEGRGWRGGEEEEARNCGQAGCPHLTGEETGPERFPDLPRSHS